MLYDIELNAEMSRKCARCFDPHAPELPRCRVLDELKEKQADANLPRARQVRDPRVGRRLGGDHGKLRECKQTAGDERGQDGSLPVHERLPSMSSCPITWYRILEGGNGGFWYHREEPLAVVHGKAVVIGVWVGRDLTRSISMLLVGTPLRQV
jgi:hypothetical protein